MVGVALHLRYKNNLPVLVLVKVDRLPHCLADTDNRPRHRLYLLTYMVGIICIMILTKLGLIDNYLLLLISNTIMLFLNILKQSYI